MQQSTRSETDWEAVKRAYDSEAPIPYDDEDRAEGLYDPNDAEAVRAAWANGKVTVGYHPHADSEPSAVYLEDDVFAFYRARGERWQAEIDRVLRAEMEAQAKPGEHEPAA